MRTWCSILSQLTSLSMLCSNNVTAPRPGSIPSLACNTGLHGTRLPRAPPTPAADPTERNSRCASKLQHSCMSAYINSVTLHMQCNTQCCMLLAGHICHLLIFYPLLR